MHMTQLGGISKFKHFISSNKFNVFIIVKIIHLPSKKPNFFLSWAKSMHAHIKTLAALGQLANPCPSCLPVTVTSHVTCTLHTRSRPCPHVGMFHISLSALHLAAYPCLPLAPPTTNVQPLPIQPLPSPTRATACYWVGCVNFLTLAYRRMSVFCPSVKNLTPHVSRLTSPIFL